MLLFSKDACCYIAILIFTALMSGKKKEKNHVSGQRDKHDTLGCLRKKLREAPGFHKTVPIYIKDLSFFLLPLALKT